MISLILGMVREIDIHDTTIKVTIALTIPNCPLRDEIAQDAAEAVDALADDVNAEIILTAMNEKSAKTSRQNSSQAGSSNPVHQPEILT